MSDFSAGLPVTVILPKAVSIPVLSTPDWQRWSMQRHRPGLLALAAYGWIEHLRRTGQRLTDEAASPWDRRDGLGAWAVAVVIGCIW